MRKILVIIPAYNEEGNIKSVVKNLEKNHPNYDYIIINDGSTDLTAEICEKNDFKVINLPVNLGLTGAFQTGMKYASRMEYDYAIQLDGDGQHNPEYIEKMYQMAEEQDLDIVIGSRFLDCKMPWTLRMIGSRILSFCILLVTGKKIKDPTSGMRLYNNRTIHRLAKQMNYGPEPDTMAYLIRCKAKIGECQVHMNDRIAGESYLNLTNSIKYMIKMVCSICIVIWFRKREWLCR